MNTAKRAAMLLALALSLAACAPQTDGKARGEARIALWRECMELAAKMPRQRDDDVHKVVDACAEQAGYLTYWVR